MPPARGRGRAAAAKSPARASRTKGKQTPLAGEGETTDDQPADQPEATQAEQTTESDKSKTADIESENPTEESENPAEESENPVDESENPADDAENLADESENQPEQSVDESTEAAKESAEQEEGGADAMDSGDGAAEKGEGAASGDDDDVQEVTDANHDDDIIIIDDDDPKSKDQSLKECWRVRVCPIPFADFCHSKEVFTTMMRSSLSFQFVMSQRLLYKPHKDWKQETPEDPELDVPWVPNNDKAFLRLQTASTQGMIEMVVISSSLGKVIQAVREIRYSRKDRIRFELKRLSKVEAQAYQPWAKGSAAEKSDPESGDKDETDDYPEEVLINFAQRFAHEPSMRFDFKHPSDHKKVPEDDYIYVKKLSDKVSDDVLKIVMNSDNFTELIQRTYGENNTGSATFKVLSPKEAQPYMELYEGLLVDMKETEISTTLTTLREAKKRQHMHFRTYFKLFDRNYTPGEKRSAEGGGDLAGSKRGRTARTYNFNRSRDSGPMQRNRDGRGPGGYSGHRGEGVMGPAPLHSIQAKMLAAQRELAILQEQARSIALMGDQGGARRQGGWGGGGGGQPGRVFSNSRRSSGGPGNRRR